MDEQKIENHIDEYLSEMLGVGGGDSPGKSCKDEFIIVVPTKDKTNGLKWNYVMCLFNPIGIWNFTSQNIY